MARAWQRFTLSWQSKHCNSEEGQMVHDPANVLAAQSPLDTKLRGLLGGMSVFTMIMTVRTCRHAPIGVSL
jgi:hypothetical protein